MIGGISSRGTKADFTTRMIETEYEQRGMKTRLKSKWNRCVQKSMPTALWNPQGFHVVTMHPPRASFNASCFIDGKVVPWLENSFRLGGVQG
jgi:hypothetical protein